MNNFLIRGKRLAAGLVLLSAIGAAWWFVKPDSSTRVQATIPITTLLNDSREGFTRTDKPWRFVFPADHGSHPDFQTEAWYFTGHLASPRGQRFGFQLTFFRFALDPQAPQSPSAWATNQIYRSHFALTDLTEEKFYADERYSRAALGLSGATTAPMRVWLEDWRAEMLSNDGGNVAFQLHAEAKDARIDLRLQSIKPLVLPEDGDLLPASGTGAHLYLAPRMAAQGEVQLGSALYQVTGFGWFDHIWGNIPIGQGQLTVNRFTLRLDDGREILALQLRRRDGSGTPITTGFIIARDGSVRRLDRRAIELETLDYWDSPRDSTAYPARWRLHIPEEAIELTITPWIDDQEVISAIRYWGGAVALKGSAKGQPITGNGHVELTGYADAALEDRG